MVVTGCQENKSCSNCVCCLNYKGKEVEGRELKLHRLTADKKLRKVRWSPLSEMKLVKKVTVCLPL